MSAYRNCTGQTEEVVRRSTGNTWPWSYRQVQWAKLVARIAHFLRQTLTWILPFSPFCSSVLEPDLEVNTNT